jgi:CBS domain-containing protein
MKHPVSAILAQKPGQVHSVLPEASVADAIFAMNQANIGAVVVVEQEKVVGIFTERDVLRKVCFRSLEDMKLTKVSEIMTTAVITGTPETTVEEAAAFFTEKRCRHLPIIEHDKLVGLISSGDVTKWIIEQQKTEIDHLSGYIAGDHHELKPCCDDD